MTVDPATPPEPATPKPVLPRTVGALNLVFGGVLLLFGGTCLASVGPFLLRNNPIQLDPAVAQNVADEFRRQMLDDLRGREQSAADGPAKAKARTDREAIESKPFVLKGEVDFDKVNADLPWVSRYLWADALTGPLLNLLLFASGAGLVARKLWALRLAMAVAGLKVVRLVALGGLLAAVVVPHVRSTTGQFARTEFGKSLLKQLAEQQAAARVGPAPKLDPDDFVQIVGAIGYGWSLFLLALGSVYPVVVLLVLSRPGARAACGGGPGASADATPAP